MRFAVEISRFLDEHSYKDRKRNFRLKGSGNGTGIRSQGKIYGNRTESGILDENFEAFSAISAKAI